MDFNLSPEQRQFQDSVRRFAETHLLSKARERAREARFPWDVARLMAKQGLLGITVPESHGGQGGTLFDAVLAIEAVAAICPRSADVVQAGNFGPLRTFAEYAPPALRERYLPNLLAGETLIGLGMSEPEAGSAVTELRTTATPDDGGYVVNGSKVFMTHSADATCFLIYLRFGPGIDNIGSVLIPRDAGGVRIGKPVRYLSGEEWCQIYFEDCHVPASHVVLGPGGFKKQIAGFNAERLGNASRALALGRYAFDVAREHAMTRRQFGRHLAEFQGLQWKFAEMEADLVAARLALYQAAAGADTGLPDAHATAIAKYLCNKAGFGAANEALQILGATGFSEETLVDYCMRRTRGWMIAGGSMEILKNRIAEGVFGRAFFSASRAREKRAE